MKTRNDPLAFAGGSLSTYLSSGRFDGLSDRKYSIFRGGHVKRFTRCSLYPVTPSLVLGDGVTGCRGA